MHPPRYYSSTQKDLVRRDFQLPLIEDFQRRQGRQLRYCGMPGELALDIATWGHLLEHLEAIEVFQDKFQSLQTHLDTHYPALRYRAHRSDADAFILSSGSRLPGVRGAGSWRHATTRYVEGVGRVWNFDVVYLDYFGKFLPYDQGSRAVQNRARAIRQLFAADREDAWQPWLLLITVESKLYGSQDRELMLQFLTDRKDGASSELDAVIDFLIDPSLTEGDQAARLVHGVLAHIVSAAAQNADVNVRNRSVVRYLGAHNTPMLHFAYEVTPAGLLAGTTDVLALLRVPFVTVATTSQELSLALSETQPPGLSQEAARRALEFLGDEGAAHLVSALAT